MSLFPIVVCITWCLTFSLCLVSEWFVQLRCLCGDCLCMTVSLLVDKDNKVLIYSVMAWIQSRTCVRFKTVKEAPGQNLSTGHTVVFSCTKNKTNTRYLIVRNKHDFKACPHRILNVHSMRIDHSMCSADRP